MELSTFKDKCTAIFAENSFIPSPDDLQLNKLYQLTEHMLRVNESMNLTAIKDIDGVVLKHYTDSLTILDKLPQGATLIDIGCGAGFPSLPLAIFRPDIRITSLDSTAKRIEYVRSTAKLLELNNITAIAGRAEEYASKPEFRESFDIATARAVAALPVLAELCLPFVKKDGLFIAMKASQGESEAVAAANAISLCGGSKPSVHKLSLTNGAISEPRVIILSKKISPTPAKYPRHFSQISKKPL